MKGLGPVETAILKQVATGPICAALLDPEDFPPAKAAEVAESAEDCGASLIFVGGSTVSDQTKLDEVVRSIKKAVRCHVILYPGNITGVSRYADAILFSSLLNSNNPYFIIGAQAIGAMQVYKSNLESIPMGYLVFGNSSSTSFIGQVNPLPTTKPQLAVIYALAAKYLGMRTLYLEAGSGSLETTPVEVIKAVRKFYDGVILVGGGITSAEKAGKVAAAGADIIVVGNLLQTPNYERTLREITDAIKEK